MEDQDQVRPVQGPRPGGGGLTLVDELVEGVLAVGPRLPPHDRPRLVPDTDAIFGDALPVGLHVALATTGRTRLAAASARLSVMTRNHLKGF